MRGSISNRPKSADKKNIEVHTKRGKASNRQGTRYASRAAGGAPEHFESMNKGQPKRSHGSSKTSSATGKASRKSKEQRITSG